MDRHGLNWGQMSRRIQAINTVADMKYIVFFLPSDKDINARRKKAQLLLNRMDANQSRLSRWAGETDRSESWLDVARVMYFQVKTQSDKLRSYIEGIDSYLDREGAGRDDH